MPFSPETRESALTQSRRRCCICHQFKGRNVEVHHIEQEANGGANDISNAVVLCFDCHADVGHYNPHHPRGSKFHPSEVRKHRDKWWDWCENHVGEPLPNDPIEVKPQSAKVIGDGWKNTVTLKVFNKSNEVWFDVCVQLLIELENVTPTTIDVRELAPKNERVIQVGELTLDQNIIYGETEEDQNAIWIFINSIDPGQTITFLVTASKDLQVNYSHVAKMKAAIVAFEEVQTLHMQEAGNEYRQCFKAPVAMKNISITFRCEKIVR